MNKKDKTTMEDKVNYVIRGVLGGIKEIGYSESKHKQLYVWIEADVADGVKRILKANNNKWKKKIEKIVKEAKSERFGTYDYDSIAVDILNLLEIGNY